MNATPPRKSINLLLCIITLCDPSDTEQHMAGLQDLDRTLCTLTAHHLNSGGPWASTPAFKNSFNMPLLDSHIGAYCP